MEKPGQVQADALSNGTKIDVLEVARYYALGLYPTPGDDPEAHISGSTGEDDGADQLTGPREAYISGFLGTLGLLEMGIPSRCWGCSTPLTRAIHIARSVMDGAIGVDVAQRGLARSLGNCGGLYHDQSAPANTVLCHLPTPHEPFNPR